MSRSIDNAIRALAKIAKAGLLDDALRLLPYHTRPFYGYAFNGGLISADMIVSIRDNPDHYIDMLGEYEDEVVITTTSSPWREALRGVDGRLRWTEAASTASSRPQGG